MLLLYFKDTITHRIPSGGTHDDHFMILPSPPFAYVRLKAKSVVVASVIHDPLNATLGISIMLIKGGDDLLVGSTGVAGFSILAAILVFPYFHNRYLLEEPHM
jgi:hypothetical protein